ncbi:MAG: hypothetical protein ABIF71_02050 [Planctomycetota bacterium]
MRKCLYLAMCMLAVAAAGAEDFNIGDRPSAMNIELGLTLPARDDILMVLRYATSREFLNYPKTNIVLGCVWQVYENAVLAAEMGRMTFEGDILPEDISTMGVMFALTF